LKFKGLLSGALKLQVLCFSVLKFCIEALGFLIKCIEVLCWGSKYSTLVRWTSLGSLVNLCVETLHWNSKLSSLVHWSFVLKLQVFYSSALKLRMWSFTLKFQGLWSTCVLKLCIVVLSFLFWCIQAWRFLVGCVEILCWNYRVSGWPSKCLKVCVEVMHHSSTVFRIYVLKHHIRLLMF
jgi:hypothetical protein